MTIAHTLAYDSLKEQYRVTLPERGNDTVLTESLDQAMAAMKKIVDMVATQAETLRGEVSRFKL